MHASYCFDVSQVPILPIRILLIDDHFVVRMGLAAALETEPGFEVVGEAGTARQALAALRKSNIDVAVCDWRLPDRPGAKLVEDIRAEFRNVRVLVLSAYESEEDVYSAIEAGADAYVPKSAPRKEIVKGIRSIHQGGQYFPQQIATKLASRVRRTALSDRERDVVREIVHGRSNKEIADVLGIATGTVKLHVVHLLEKLGVRDRTQAASVAIQRGIVRLD